MVAVALTDDLALKCDLMPVAMSASEWICYNRAADSYLWYRVANDHVGSWMLWRDWMLHWKLADHLSSDDSMRLLSLIAWPHSRKFSSCDDLLICLTNVSWRCVLCRSLTLQLNEFYSWLLLTRWQRDITAENFFLWRVANVVWRMQCDAIYCADRWHHSYASRLSCNNCCSILYAFFCKMQIDLVSLIRACERAFATRWLRNCDNACDTVNAWMCLCYSDGETQCWWCLLLLLVNCSQREMQKPANISVLLWTVVY